MLRHCEAFLGCRKLWDGQTEQQHSRVIASASFARAVDRARCRSGKHVLCDLFVVLVSEITTRPQQTADCPKPRDH